MPKKPDEHLELEDISVPLEREQSRPDEYSELEGQVNKLDGDKVHSLLNKKLGLLSAVFGDQYEAPSKTASVILVLSIILVVVLALIESESPRIDEVIEILKAVIFAATGFLFGTSVKNRSK